jgi:hypothetical protein
MSLKKLKTRLVGFKCTEEEAKIIDSKVKILSKKLRIELTTSDFIRYLVVNTDV